MAKKRLINCDFLNASSFIDNLSNKAKLLYIYMFLNSDDRGWNGNTKSLMETLEKNDSEHQQESLSLLGNSYENAIQELVEKGLVLDFVDNHNNHIYLCKHWFVHNNWKKGLLTNYFKFAKQVDLVDNEYVRKPLKESNNNINYDKPIYDKPLHNKDISQEEWERLCGGNDNKENTDNDDDYTKDLPY